LEKTSGYFAVERRGTLRLDSLSVFQELSNQPPQVPVTVFMYYPTLQRELFSTYMKTAQTLANTCGGSF